MVVMIMIMVVVGMMLQIGNGIMDGSDDDDIGFSLPSHQVAKPLDVKTKFINVEEDILLEVQIQNITSTPMFLEVVNFDPYAGFSVLDLNSVKRKGNEEEEEEEEEGKEEEWVT